MENDIYIEAILNCAKSYVNDNVEVVIEQSTTLRLIGIYNLTLKYKEHSVSYNLHYQYQNRKSYIMRVVSDLCERLAKQFNTDRNYFFKVNQEDQKKRWLI